MTDTRDPRIDPQAGDVLRDKFGAEATVQHVQSAIVTRVDRDTKDRTNVGLAYWRQWYRDATILHRGDQ